MDSATINALDAIIGASFPSPIAMVIVASVESEPDLLSSVALMTMVYKLFCSKLRTAPFAKYAETCPELRSTVKYCAPVPPTTVKVMSSRSSSVACTGSPTMVPLFTFSIISAVESDTRGGSLTSLTLTVTRVEVVIPPASFAWTTNLNGTRLDKPDDSNTQLASTANVLREP